jgi:hypothetical protein
MSLAQQGLPTHAVLDLRKGTIKIKKLEVDISVLEAVCEADKKVLWRFVRKNGAITAVPYGEHQVIWIEEQDLKRKPGEDVGSV